MCSLFPDKETEASEAKYLVLSHPPGSVRGEMVISALSINQSLLSLQCKSSGPMLQRMCHQVPRPRGPGGETLQEGAFLLERGDRSMSVGKGGKLYLIVLLVAKLHFAKGIKTHMDKCQS